MTKNNIGGVSVRSILALGVGAMLMVNGVPPVALAQPSPAPAAAHAALPLIAAGGNIRPLVRPPRALLRGNDGDPVVAANDAVRFLEQATFGPSFATDPSDPNFPDSVAHLQAVGFEAWLQEQFNAPVLFPDDPTIPNIGTNYVSPGIYDPNSQDPAGCLQGNMCWMPANRPNECINDAPNGVFCNRNNYTVHNLQQQFFVNALTGADQLRQRVAWALSQIDVISELDIRPVSRMIPYAQLFDRDAFGNFRQVLYDVTVNPGMGEYLNMRGNTQQNVNENYAREILQLFSVGLNLLNPDGTLATSPPECSVAPCPTYSQETINAFARVFTAWNLGAQIPPLNIPNYRDPMILVNEANNHDHEAKALLDYTGVDPTTRDLPGSDNAVMELDKSLNNIFNHPNVGPFIGRLLIQKMVTSNPTPAYVQSVTNAFNAGAFTGPGGTLFGSSQRGDMQAAVAAILLDPEARNDPSGNPDYGHLREPVLFITNTLRALGISPDGGITYTTDFVLGDSFLPSAATHNLRMDQDVFRPPTVFSYYPPDNQLAGSTLLGPEFGIQSTTTSLARINFIRDVAFHQMPIDTTNRPLGTWIDTTQFEPLAGNPGGSGQLLDELNNRLMHATMTDALRTIVLNRVTDLGTCAAGNLTCRVQEAIYLIASSSQYQVER